MVYAIYSTHTLYLLRGVTQKSAHSSWFIQFIQHIHTLYLLQGVTQNPRIRQGLFNIFSTFSILTAWYNSESAHLPWFKQFIKAYTYLRHGVTQNPGCGFATHTLDLLHGVIQEPRDYQTLTFLHALSYNFEDCFFVHF